MKIFWPKDRGLPRRPIVLEVFADRGPGKVEAAGNVADGFTFDQAKATYL